MRVHVEFPLDVHDVRRDEQQAARAGLPGPGTTGPAGSSRVAGANVSYWPSTRDARNDSSIPTSTPVTLPPTVPSAIPPMPPGRRSCILPSSGLRISRKPATFAFTQPTRSTMSTGVPFVCASASPYMRVNARTCSSEERACLRNSATIARASSPLTSGPGRINRCAVATARFQSTISAPPTLVMPSRYVAAPALGVG